MNQDPKQKEIEVVLECTECGEQVVEEWVKGDDECPTCGGELAEIDEGEEA